MHFRHCPRCKLLAMSGEYCAGCGAHLHGPPVTGVTQRNAIALLAIVLAGIIAGFGLGMTGVFQAPATMTLTVTPTVQNCAGTIAYTATLTSDGEPVPDTRVTLLAGNNPVETLRTDVNGRVTSTVPYSASWCGAPLTLAATADATTTRSQAEATHTIAIRVPVELALDAPERTTAGTPTLITVEARDAYDGTALRGAIIRLADGSDEHYATTDLYGRASFTYTGETGTATLTATLLGDARYERANSAATLAITERSITDRIAALQEHVVLIRTPISVGSGVVIERTDSSSTIITNRHVIERAAPDEIIITTGNTNAAARTIEIAPGELDLAIITTEPVGVPATIEQALPSRGEPVIAIGNPLGFTGSVSRGIVSNTVDTVTTTGAPFTVVQTDAAVNPGNSGGGLFLESTGELVGIVSAKRFDAEGIGFAIAAQSFPNY